MKCLWGIALSCFCALVSLGLLQAENLSREPLASFPPFTEESLLPFDPETQEIVDDGLVLTHPGIAYATYEQRLSDTSITVEAEFADDDAEALFLGLRIQSRPPLSGYVFDLARNGDVSLVTLDSGDDTVLASGNTGFSTDGDALMICFRMVQQSLAAWVWPKDSEQPTEPAIETSLGLPLTYTEGRPLVGVRSGAARFASVDIHGLPFRLINLGFQPLKEEVRLKIDWTSEPGGVYRIESSTDRVLWERLYLVKATEATTEAVIVGSFTEVPAPFRFFQVVDVTSNSLVQGNPLPLIPATPRFAIAWRSAEDRVYGFEWSQDLETWPRYPGLAVPGADGTTLTDTILPLPEELNKEDADRLYLRVLDLDNDNGFGINQEMMEP
ncbi:MAG: hypothetical protein GWQ05_20260 [Verrucomicrobiaceae bacterium]|nr:hypothetical protein [Verrucomicrobiaceae bacterium]